MNDEEKNGEQNNAGKNNKKRKKTTRRSTGGRRPIRDATMAVKLLGGNRFNYVKRLVNEILPGHLHPSSYDPSNLEAIYHLGEIIEQAIRESRSGAHKWVGHQSRTLRVSGSQYATLEKILLMLVNDMSLGKRRADAALLEVA